MNLKKGLNLRALAKSPSNRLVLHLACHLAKRVIQKILSKSSGPIGQFKGSFRSTSQGTKQSEGHGFFLSTSARLRSQGVILPRCAVCNTIHASTCKTKLRACFACEEASHLVKDYPRHEYLV